MVIETSKRKLKELISGRKNVIDEKLQKKWWGELLFHAKEYALTNDGDTEIILLKDAVIMYLLFGMSGQPGSRHNRKILIQRILLELGNGVGGQHVLNNQQLTKLKVSLNQIITPQRNINMHRP